MKINFVKIIVVLGISAVLGLICYYIAGAAESRNWISLAVTAVSVLICLATAYACDYDRGNRNVNIRTAASTMSAVVIIANFAFACFAYPPIIYGSVLGLLTLLNIAIVYGLARK